MNSQEKMDLVNRWIAALESGKYKQTKGSLVRKEAGHYCYCATGLLLEIAGYPVVPRPVFDTVEDHDQCGFAIGDMVRGGLIPDEMVRDLFLDKPAPNTAGSFELWIINMNDVQGTSFAGIARMLREYYLPYLEEQCQIS